MSGEVELNPDPSTYQKNNPFNLPAISILELRLHHFGLKPQHFRGAGDCFFRTVSHQLHGNPNSHGIIRAAGVEFSMANPERFIESNFQRPWRHYLTSMKYVMSRYLG